MPTLWFTLHDLPMGEPAFDLDAVYRYLVPLEYKSALRATGVVGGISAAVSVIICGLHLLRAKKAHTITAPSYYRCPIFLHTSLPNERSNGKV
jgi:hypothetical protein